MMNARPAALSIELPRRDDEKIISRELKTTRLPHNKLHDGFALLCTARRSAGITQSHDYRSEDPHPSAMCSHLQLIICSDTHRDGFAQASLVTPLLRFDCRCRQS